MSFTPVWRSVPNPSPVPQPLIDAAWEAADQIRQISRLVQYRDERQDYETPPEVFEPLAAEFGGFDVDVAASASNAKCARFYTPGQDSLQQPWEGVLDESALWSYAAAVGPQSL